MSSPSSRLRPELAEDPPDSAVALAEELAGVAGSGVRAILLYGSHLLKAAPDRFSAYDFVVVVDGYRDFYRRMEESGELHRPAWLMSALAQVLPPNVVAFEPAGGTRGIAKCLVLSHAHLRRALSLPPPDHFVLARLVQRVALVWARDDASSEEVGAVLRRARSGVLAWVGPFLDEPFGPAEVGRKMLELCYRAEVRPEAANRSAVVFEAQEEYFRQIFGPVLRRGVERGVLAGGRDGYRFTSPPGSADRIRWKLHFAASKARVTARWLKHMVTFDKWLPYIRRKVERRTGMAVELTPLEERYPLIFLWPRLIRVLRRRPAAEALRPVGGDMARDQSGEPGGPS